MDDSTDFTVTKNAVRIVAGDGKVRNSSDGLRGEKPEDETDGQRENS